MELGATICTPKNPKCLFCPVHKICKAYQTGKVKKFPTVKVKKKVPHYQKYALIAIKDNSIWLRQRTENEMLSGLWGFVLADELPKGLKILEKVNHAYTHFKLTVTPVITRISKKTEGKFISSSELDALALSTLDYKILGRIKEQEIL
jgi:A/G-specific adenine glycosylase